VNAAPESDRRKWWVLAAVSLGMFMALLDATIVNIAVPAIMKDLNSGVTGVSWVLNAYNLGMAALFLTAGRLADRLGQKRVFIGGLLLFTVFSLACGLSPNIQSLIGFRVGQAIGGAAMAPVSLAILLGVFPQRQHGLAVGVWGALGAVAAALGPSIGGVLVQYAQWHWIFFINVPIGLIALGMALWLVPERRRAEAGASVDLPAVLLSAAGLFCLTLALIQGNSWGWSSGRVIGLLVAAVACYPVFLAWELRARTPMFDLRLMRIRSFTAANTAMLFIGTSMGGAIFLLVIFLVNVLGYTELRAALAITPMPVTALLISPFVGRLADRIGPRIPATIGALFFAGGMLALSQMGAASSAWDATWRVMLVGVGIAFSMPVLSAAAMGSLPPQSAGVGSGALATFRQMGFVLGVAILVSIFSHTVTAEVRTATRQAVTYVNAQGLIPAAARAQIVSALQQNAKAARSGGNPAQRLSDPLANAPVAASGSPQSAQRQAMGKAIGGIYKDHVAQAFHWPYYAAAIAALLAVPFTLMTGRRLGEHAGDQELTRRQRRAAADGAGR
jgi:EmrB/QacA subfamily drug resistance transporter